MKLFGFVALTMCAFAANSVLTRIGVALQGMDPLDFATVRTAAGALMLWLLVIVRKAPSPPVLTRKRMAGAAALAVYMVGFSWAYITLDAGLGALILFGVLQVVIFCWAVFEGNNIPLLRWIGAVIALTGLCVLLWPSGEAAVHLGGAISMTIAGVSRGLLIRFWVALNLTLWVQLRATFCCVALSWQRQWFGSALAPCH